MEKQILKKFVGKQAASCDSASRVSTSRGSASRSAGFTLVEILVVLGIIAILAALLFPAFKNMQERGRQTNCAANLKQIAVAVQQYYNDEKFYPSSLTVLMPVDAELRPDDPATPLPADETIKNTNSAAYLTSLDVGKCQDDDTETATTRYSLSYGAFGPFSDVTGGAPYPAGLGATEPPAQPADPGQYVWNYWGYNSRGYAYKDALEAAAANPAPSSYLVYKVATSPYNHPNLGKPPFDESKPRNVVEHSLSNRYAPKSTIITHCVYHRMATANNLNQHSELYYSTQPTAVQDAQGAKDIILLLSGEIKTVDVSSWKDSADKQWQNQSKIR
ncbi:MAG TPA: type II secretion system protein [Abditibacteriaceae bacterium]